MTVIRPVKGLDPELYQCLAATFRQVYPKEKLAIRFCVSSRNDPAYPVVEHVLADFPGFDAEISVEDEDPFLTGNERGRYGPNPKIRNMSRAYREANSDIIWILDCNVWVGKGVCGRMVDRLCGFQPNGIRTQRYKFVHQLPLVVHTGSNGMENGGLYHENARNGNLSESDAGREALLPGSWSSLVASDTGSKLEEMFMSSAHAKFYTAINTVLIAPCIVGKSNMFRRSHLHQLTSEDPARLPGLDYFSHNICEDHLVGDLLWKGKTLDERKGENLGKHALLFGDLAVQPMAAMSLRDYIARRIRWLRVRKFTVTLATLVEPGTESFLCSLYGAYAFMTLTDLFDVTLTIPSWLRYSAFWICSVFIWAVIDRALYLRLHSARSIEMDEHVPSFARALTTRRRTSLTDWALAWLGREALALPVWTWAVYGGTSVKWRGKRFRVGVDMKVREISEQQSVSMTGRWRWLDWKSKRP